MSDKPFNPEYANMANNCPYCGSESINATYEETDDNFTTYGVDCDDCGAEWGEQHTLQYWYSRPHAEFEVDFKQVEADKDLLEHAINSATLSDEDFESWFNNLDLSEAKDYIERVWASAKKVITKATERSYAAGESKQPKGE